LRERGLTENVVLLPHGVVDRAPLKAEAVRSLLGLSGCAPVIGSFGFLLPGKGLPELIQAFTLILRAFPAAYLLLLNAEYPTPESRQERERCLALMRLLELQGHSRLISDFLETEEMFVLLSACDVIVFPYQRSEESASGAVRLGLAAGRQVLTTPLPVFGDLAEIVVQLPGTEPRQIAEGVQSLLADDRRKEAILQRQREWVRANSWAAQASRLANIIQGCVEETRGIELRAPREMPALKEKAGRSAGASTLREEHIVAAQKFLDRPVVGAPANVSTVHEAKPAREGSGLLWRLGSRGGRSAPEPADKNLLSRADRARDARDWVSAVRYYRQALEQRPHNPPIWVQYGHALKESGNVAEAENAYRKSLELEGDVADTHLQLGHALKLQGRRIEACAAYFRALALDPTLEHAFFELRALGWTRGRIELALRRERDTST